MTRMFGNYSVISLFGFFKYIFGIAPNTANDSAAYRKSNHEKKVLLKNINVSISIKKYIILKIHQVMMNKNKISIICCY